MKIPKVKVVIFLVEWSWVCIIGSFDNKYSTKLFYIVTNFPSVQVVMAIMVTILWIGALLALLLNSGKQEVGDLTGRFLSNCDGRLPKEFGQWKGLVLIYIVTRI